jgi:Ca2+-binding RTX toxin-like protein
MANNYITTNQSIVNTNNGDSTFIAQGVTVNQGIDMRGNGGGDQFVNIYGTLFGSVDDYFSTTSGRDQIFIGSTGAVSIAWFGAIILGGGGHIITNQGTISAMSYGGAIEITPGSGAHTTERTYITNTGTISSSLLDVSRGYSSSTIYIYNDVGASATINNSGNILSTAGFAITLPGGDDVVTNSGFIQGGIFLGAGNDYADSRQGTITGEIRGYTGNDTIYGSLEDNKLIGEDGNDRLEGYLGADDMIGGAGDDIYWVDNSEDVVDENNATYGGSGTDLIVSSITFDLSDTVHVIGGVERLSLRGTADINGYGSVRSEIIEGNVGANVILGEAGNDRLYGYAGDDRLVGSAGTDTLYGGGGNDLLFGGDDNDVLDGGTGADTMSGGAGNDVYLVDDVGDVVDESASGSTGTDTIQSSITRSLSDTVHVKGAVENLTLVGSSAISGTGNSLANTITGNSGNNTLDGAAGNDTLIGGAGNDNFQFTTSLVANFDTISGFVHGTDKIVLENAIFTQLSVGVLAASNFAINAPADANDFIIYNTTTGVLSYDSNGNGAGGATNFATLTGVPGITQSDFQVV